MAWSAAIAASLAIGLGVAMVRSERERRGVWPDGDQDPRRSSGPEPPDRTFGLLPGERPAEGLRRVALGQLDLAIELLGSEGQAASERNGAGRASGAGRANGASGTNVAGRASGTGRTGAEAVHETRKAIKRLRATMRLLEGELGAKRAERERSLLGDVAKSLAGARDAEVMVQTLDGLMDRHPRKLGRRRALVELRGRLERERAAAAGRAERDAAARAQALAELEELRARVASWRLRDRSAGRLSGQGLERIYRGGRAGRRRARARKSGPRALHRWRKHVKDLRYALEAIDVRDGRGSGGRVAKLAKRADGLGEALGEEHDLMLLAELARKHRPLRRHPRARKRLLKAIAKRRAKLRAEALREGERLFERKPERFARRVKAASRH
ncbi:MAG TPA: CHAD domain-containing protein [Solirubrobacteraceae bacterium]|nr:CHAD domain-containing protein [Solirubrobacteraceae bacterium]